MHCYAVIFAQNWPKPMKKRKNRNDWLTIMYYLSILCAHTNASPLRFEHTSNYGSCETTYSFKMLRTIGKNFILHAAGFLDLHLVIEKTDLNSKLFVALLLKKWPNY